MANLSIVTITDWADFEYSNEATESIESYKPIYCALPERVIGAVSAYSTKADTYIESKGKSTMIRVFSSQATGSDKQVLEEAHNDAKEFTIYHFNELVNEHDTAYNNYLAGITVCSLYMYGNDETSVEDFIKAKDDIAKFERICDGKYYHLRKGSLDKYTQLVEMGVL